MAADGRFSCDVLQLTSFLLFLRQLEDCTLQVSPGGHYLDLDLSLGEQRDELESFYDDVA